MDATATLVASHRRAKGSWTGIMTSVCFVPQGGNLVRPVTRLGRRRGGCREHRSPKTGLQRRDGKRVTVRAAPPRRRGDLRAPEGERGKAALLAVWHRREGRKRKVGCAPLALLRLPQSVRTSAHDGPLCEIVRGPRGVGERHEEGGGSQPTAEG